MFKLVAPATVVFIAVFVAFAVPKLLRAHLAGKLAWRKPKPERTWALFVDWKPTGRRALRLATEVRGADREAEVVVYKRKDRPDLCRSLGVTESPTLVLGDGSGGARVRLQGRAAIDAWLDRRYAPR